MLHIQGGRHNLYTLKWNENLQRIGVVLVELIIKFFKWDIPQIKGVISIWSTGKWDQKVQFSKTIIISDIIILEGTHDSYNYINYNQGMAKRF